MVNIVSKESVLCKWTFISMVKISMLQKRHSKVNSRAPAYSRRLMFSTR